MRDNSKPTRAELRARSFRAITVLRELLEFAHEAEEQNAQDRGDRLYIQELRANGTLSPAIIAAEKLLAEMESARPAMPMKPFKPRNEHERMACTLEWPRFNIGQRVRVKPYGKSSFEGIVTQINLRTVDWPVWHYEIDFSPVQRTFYEIDAL